MCLEGCGECGLALLAAHQAGAQQVDQHLVAIPPPHLLQVGLEGGRRQLRAARHLDLVRANLNNTGLTFARANKMQIKCNHFKADAKLCLLITAL